MGVSFQKGDRFLLYSDGVLDTQAPDGERFGVDRLLALVERRATDTPRALLDALAIELSGFSGGASPVDDVTAVLVATGGGSDTGALHRQRVFEADLE